MARSLCLEDFTDSQRRTFEELGLGPGQRFYIRKTRRLSDTELDDERRRQLRLEVDARDLHRSLAQLFDRNPKTIARRLRSLPIDASARAAAVDDSGARARKCDSRCH